MAVDRQVGSADVGMLLALNPRVELTDEISLAEAQRELLAVVSKVAVPQHQQAEVGVAQPVPGRLNLFTGAAVHQEGDVVFTLISGLIDQPRADTPALIHCRRQQADTFTREGLSQAGYRASQSVERFTRWFSKCGGHPEVEVDRSDMEHLIYRLRFIDCIEQLVVGKTDAQTTTR